MLNIGPCDVLMDKSIILSFSGKGPNIWDDWSHAYKIENNDTGDVACDSYHKYQEDIVILKEMGVT